MNNQFSENLKRIRKENNLSQEQLAQEIGVSRQAISKWESKVAYPEMDKIIMLCDKFNINIDDLLHNDIKEIKKEEESKKKINNIIESFLNYITDTINLFSSMNFKSKIKCIIEQLIIITTLAGFSCIILLITNELLGNMISSLPYRLSYLISNTFESVIMLLCFITSTIVITHVFKIRYLNYYNKTKEAYKENKKEMNNEEIKIENPKIVIRDPKHSEYKFINMLFKFIIGIIKLFALMFAIFLISTLIFLIMNIVISFTISKTGLFFIGILIALISSSIITILILLITLNFIFNRKNEKKKIIWGFILSVIILGIGIGLTLLGALNFEILEENETMEKIETREFKMNDNLYIDNRNNIEFIETDIEDIKVEYTINKYCKIEDYEEIEPYIYCNNYNKMIKEFIKNMNNKKIIPITSNAKKIKIYTTKENFEKLKNNEQKYLR
jgi:transcriptional regulator with XRE-family HTH domain